MLQIEVIGNGAIGSLVRSFRERIKERNIFLAKNILKKRKRKLAKLFLKVLIGRLV